MPKTFAESLRALRERKRLTRTAVAEMIGVTRPAVSLWEAGRREPKDGDAILRALRDVPVGADPHTWSGFVRIKAHVVAARDLARANDHLRVGVMLQKVVEMIDVLMARRREKA